MRKTDGFTMASAAAALLMAAPAMAGFDPSTAESDDPVRIAICENVHDAGQSACKGFGNDAGAGNNSCSGAGFVAISSGNDNFSSVLCEAVLGGNLAANATATEDNTLAELDGVHITYCNDVFTCAGLSACKGNGNPAGPGVNTCHAIGFVGVYTGDASLSDALCEKLGGTILSSL